MRRCLIIAVVILAALAFPAILYSQSGVPMLRAVEPALAHRGDVLTVTGKNLDRVNVAALYLTDGQNDCQVAIRTQSTESITFTVPPDAKNGRFALMVLTTEDPPKFLEEPVKVVIE